MAAITSWDIEVNCGNYNTSIEVEVVEEGINIGCEFLSWDEIDAARASVAVSNKPSDEKGEGHV